MEQSSLAELLADAVARHTAGHWAEAEQIYRSILQIDPGHAHARHLLGVLALQQGDANSAIDSILQAIAIAPRAGDFHLNLGCAYSSQQRYADAAASFRRAAHLKPQEPVSHFNLGNALFELREYDAAIEHFRRAIELRPSYVKAHSNLATALFETGAVDEAADRCREALQWDPDFPEALHLLGGALAQQGRLAEALSCLDRAHRLAPSRAGFQSDWLASLNYDPLLHTDKLLVEHQRWASLHAGAIVRRARHANSPDPERRLRIGYVSADFCNHAAACFFQPIVEYRDSRAVENILYAQLRQPDFVSIRLKNMADGWREISTFDDDCLADLIVADRIDILVDLCGHTPGNRLLAFARKPAPLQATYLGYPTTTALGAIDFCITDAVADPDTAACDYTEVLARLPATFACYCPPPVTPPIAPPPALANGWITFGSLHKLEKLNPQVLDLWVSIVKAVPRARLLVLRDALRGNAQEYLRGELAARGLDRRQMDLRHEFPAGSHWECYREIDISLDPFPWTGHTTACESLWMGVPVVSLRGKRHAARMVSSVLSALGRSEWIAASAEEYLVIAKRLAENLPELAKIRAGLRAQMLASPVCDGPAFTRSLEATYRDLWRQWCARQT